MEEILMMDAFATLAHSRQSRVYHWAQTEHVDLEHSAHLLVFPLFHSSEIADAGVVHEYVDAAELILGGFDGGLNLLLIGDVKGENQILRRCGQVFHLVGMTCGHDRVISECKDVFSNLTPEPSRTTCNEPNRRFSDHRFSV
jgi:hypothetical protein